MAITLDQLASECQISHPHPYVCQSWKFDKDEFRILDG